MAYYLARLFTRYVSNQSTCERTAEQLPHDSRVVAVPQRVQLIYTYIRNTFRWLHRFRYRLIPTITNRIGAGLARSISPSVESRTKDTSI